MFADVIVVGPHSKFDEHCKNRLPNLTATAPLISGSAQRRSPKTHQISPSDRSPMFEDVTAVGVSEKSLIFRGIGTALAPADEV